MVLVVTRRTRRLSSPLARSLRRHLVIDQRLGNLIWVWSVASRDVGHDWYPGDAVVDAVGHDRYDVAETATTPRSTGISRGDHQHSARAVRGRLRAESGGFPNAPFSWAMTWTGSSPHPERRTRAPYSTTIRERFRAIVSPASSTAICRLHRELAETRLQGDLVDRPP